MEKARWSLLHVAKEERRLSTLEGTRLELMRHRAARQSESRGKVNMNKGLCNTRLWKTKGILELQGAKFEVIL